MIICYNGERIKAGDRMDPILDQLNEQQYNAVTHYKGPMLVMAGAGSGKTKVLTNRIAYLIRDKGVSPYNILAITFTNKAAKEMKERVIGLVGDIGRNMYISTFHSMCAHILRQDIYLLGYNENYVIYDERDQLSLIKEVMTDLNIDSKMYTPRRVLNTISNLKNDYIFPEQYKATHEHKLLTGDFESIVSRVYERYQHELKEANALDFDDLIMLTILLFEKEKDILSFYQDKFQFILVDEYQDTNTSQFRLVKMLSEKHNNVFVVGDTDQSIYSWRGANIRNIQEFEEDFKQADEPVEIIYLEQNYRSYQAILDCANAVIRHNYPKDTKIKKLWSEKHDPNNKVTYYRAVNSDQEVEYIADTVSHLIQNEGYLPQDIAVLYRTNALSLNLEKTFQRYQIPYEIIGNVGFFERKEIKDLVAYLRLIVNTNDNMSYLRVVNEPRRGIGKQTLNQVKDYAFKNNISFFEASKEIDTLSARAKNSLGKFVEMIEKFQHALDDYPLNDFIDYVLTESDYLPMLERDKDEDSKSRIENLNEFKSLVLDFEDNVTEEDILATGELTSLDKLAVILNTIAISSDQKEESIDSVKLMTVHAAKGLEFPVVFIYSVEENLFPLLRSDTTDDDIEEERRLMYVAITRAMERLYITNSEMRKIYGDIRVYPESRFLLEIPNDLLDFQGVVRRKRTTMKREEITQKSMNQPSSFFAEPVKKDISGVRAGTKCTHKKFGEGVVVNVSGDTATIAFPVPYGIKKLDIHHPALSFNK